MPAIDTVLQHFNNVRQTGKVAWSAQCPAHDDGTNSLSVGMGEDDKVVIHCHAGCATNDVLSKAKLSSKDLFTNANGHGKGKPKGQIIAKYDYVDENGTLLYQVVRFEPKDFRQRRPDGDNWIWSLQGVQRVPYRLPELIAADRNSFVYVNEGEKDVDALRALGFVATCNVGGAGKWRPEYTKFFKDRTVVILPDNDDAGRKHAVQVAQHLHGVAGVVAIVHLPGLGPKEDVSNWLANGGSRSQLERLSAAAKTFDPSAVIDDTESANSADDADSSRVASQIPVYQQLSMSELDSADYQVEYLIDRTLVAGQPCLVAGGKKTLKTSLLVDLGISLATGSPFLGHLKVNRAVRVAMMSGESGLATLQETARRVADAKGFRLSDIGGMIISPDLPICGHVLHMEALQRFLRDNETEVLILDPAYLCLPTEGSEGSLFAMGALLRSISEVCQQNGVTLVLAHHTRKNVADPFAPVELEDIAWAGFSEFARQWLLASRREKYVPGTGDHRLWLTVGGSAGHSSLWALDVHEGVYDGHTPRQWNVTIWTPDEARESAADAKERAKQARQDEKLDRDKRAIIEAMMKMPGRRGTKTEIKGRSARPTPALNLALAALLSDGHIVECDIKKGNRNTPYEGYQLQESIDEN